MKDRRWKVMWLDMEFVIDVMSGFNFRGNWRFPEFPKLPDDVKFIDANYSWERRQLGVRIWSSEFPQVPDGEPVPNVIDPIVAIVTYDAGSDPILARRAADVRRIEALTAEVERLRADHKAYQDELDQRIKKAVIGTADEELVVRIKNEPPRLLQRRDGLWGISTINAPPVDQNTLLYFPDPPPGTDDIRKMMQESIEKAKREIVADMPLATGPVIMDEPA